MARRPVALPHTPRRRRSTRQLKLILAALIVVGGVGSVGISGTWAIMNSESRNPGGTVAAGTLTLGNKVDTGTVCYSFGPGSSGNANAACSPLLSSSTLQYPGSGATAKLTLTGAGSLDVASLSLYMPTCTAATSPSATVVGSGNPCTEISDAGTPTGLQLAIQETNAAWSPTTCWYPVSAAGSCTASPDYAAAAPNSVPLFAEYANGPGASVDLGRGPVHGASRYFMITVSLPTNASNSLQGRQATFGLTWHVTT
jgi:hypothetical protein